MVGESLQPAADGVVGQREGHKQRQPQQHYEFRVEAAHDVQQRGAHHTPDADFARALPGGEVGQAVEAHHREQDGQHGERREHTEELVLRLVEPRDAVREEDAIPFVVGAQRFPPALQRRELRTHIPRRQAQHQVLRAVAFAALEHHQRLYRRVHAGIMEILHHADHREFLVGQRGRGLWIAGDVDLLRQRVLPTECLHRAPVHHHRVHPVTGDLGVEVAAGNELHAEQGGEVGISAHGRHGLVDAPFRGVHLQHPASTALAGQVLRVCATSNEALAH